ncbi:MAG: hypothetical protein Q7T74_00995 [Candidatus Saccharibacteria bacterium]|nr:hypothetical protein [Candidatus Saccharibacteria bacterium]
MSEFDPREVIDAVFPEDEKVNKAFQDVRDINEIIIEGGFDGEEGHLRALINECEGLLPFLGSVVTMSGKVIYFKFTPEDQETIVAKQVTINEAPVLAKGFAAMTLGDDTAEQYGHTFSFDMRQDGLVSPPANKSVPQFIGWARLDEVHIKPRDDNRYDIQEYLQTYVPEVLEDLDDRLLNTKNEVDALNALGGFGLSHGPVEDVDTQRNMVESYTNVLLEFDKVIPYSALVKGPIHIMDSDGDITATTIVDGWESALVVPSHVKMIPKFIYGQGSKPRFSKEVSIPALVADIHEVKNGIYEQKYITAGIPLGVNFIIRSNASNITEIEKPE